jgi:CheY-like chemotaxis protein/anti-sigma regulatory factor (Ser/Thr protein kinase)
MGTSFPAGVVEPSPNRDPVVHGPTTILVVDDSAFDRQLVGQLLDPMKDLRLVFARNAHDGLATIDRESPAVVLTDLVMPDMEGLELVKQVRSQHPQISVILVTAYGSEEVAMEALRAGAANYIPKKRLARDLVPTIRQALSIAAMTRERRRIVRCMVRRESDFVLDNDPELILPLLKLLHEEIAGLNLGDAGCQLQVGIALQEALYNALFHGNLEVSSDLRQEDERLFDALAEERRFVEPYRSRRIRVQVALDRASARFVITDQGPGFDTSIFNLPVQPEDLNRIGGRGLLLIRTFIDQVSFNASGNQITMVKFRTGLD